MVTVSLGESSLHVSSVYFGATYAMAQEPGERKELRVALDLEWCCIVLALCLNRGRLVG